MSLLNRWVVIGAGSLLAASLVPSDALLRAQSVPAAGVENRAGQPLIDFSREIQPIFKQVPAPSVTGRPKLAGACGCTRPTSSSGAASRDRRSRLARVNRAS